MKQINSQSDLIWMRSFAGPSYLTIRFSVYIILMWDPCIFSLLQSLPNWIQLHMWGTSAICTLFQWTNNRNTFFLLQLSIRQVPAQVILLWKRPPKLCIECHFVPLWWFPPKSFGNSRTAWPISAIYISFSSILNALSYGINLFLRCSYPIR